MIGFRTILVHAYLAVDRAIIHEVSCNRVKELAESRQVFAEFL